MKESVMNKNHDIPGLYVRYTEARDAKYLREWFFEPGILRWFPMLDETEIDDAVYRWIGFSKFRCSLTAEYNNIPCGIVTLYLQPYKKLAHQCEFGIIVSKEMRGKGVGTALMNDVIYLAKEHFHIELLHLQVYDDNPAISLYRRFGFKDFGNQTHWIKDKGEYVSRLFMERFI
jgi:RimJ/RimL family protein N-acetyltransferase